MGNFYFSIFLWLMWEFLDLESERGGSVCWPNNKIIDAYYVLRTIIINQPWKIMDYNQRHHSLGIDRYDIERMEKDGNVIILKINAYHSDRSFRTCEKNKLRHSSLMNPFHHFSKSLLWIFQQSSLKLSFNPTPASTSKFT